MHFVDTSAWPFWASAFVIFMLGAVPFCASLFQKSLGWALVTLFIPLIGGIAWWVWMGSGWTRDASERRSLARA
jgi:hypothetical protein